MTRVHLLVRREALVACELCAVDVDGDRVRWQALREVGHADDEVRVRQRQLELGEALEALQLRAARRVEAHLQVRIVERVDIGVEELLHTHALCVRTHTTRPEA